MYKKIPYFLLVIEVLMIFVVNVFYARFNASLNVSEIEVPEGMRLTLIKNISISTSEGTIVLPKDTIINPTFIFPDKTVYFNYENIIMYSHLHTSWESFIEQEQLEKLKEEAEHKTREKQSEIIKHGVIYGIVQASAWLLVIGTVTLIFVKKKLYKAILILQIGLPLIVLLLFMFIR